MKRILINLHEDQDRWLAEYAKKQDISKSSIIRAALKIYQFKAKIIDENLPPR